ncbi:MAG TPA: hypothetical protein VFE62_19640 [Gemmataceae bacterium]|nr:hypothetical protein [Gemmataceae bacterium]
MKRVQMIVIATLGLFAFAGEVFAQTSIHKNSFEAKTGFYKSGSDADFHEIAHKIDDRDPHNGQGAEYIELDVKQGKYINYVYQIGKAPVAEEFRAALWMRANRPGIKMFARVVLPNERDPNNLQNVLTTYIPGNNDKGNFTYEQAGPWQLLELGRTVNQLKAQQQLMNAQYGKSLNFTDAYIDALILNVYAGPGVTKVWVDDLEVGPVTSPAPVAVSPDNNNAPKIPNKGAPGSIVRFEGNRLVVGKQRMFFRAIRYTDTMLPVLRNAGFNTVCFDRNVNPALLNEAGELGLWIVPELRVMNDDGLPLAADEITKQVNRNADNDALLFRHIKGVLDYEKAQVVARQVSTAHQADPAHPIAADVWDGLMPYSRSIQLMGMHRFPLMTTMELPKYREWLETRQKLANPNSFTWTWIQTHLPDQFGELLYNQSTQAEFKEPVGPQPEQVRLLAYSAVAAGCRGLGFWSDRFLADSHQGRDRLLCCALLNQELDMMRDMLVGVDDPPQWVDTSHVDIKAAVLRSKQGVLVIPIWQGRFSQFVPGQAAVSKLTLVVPQVPITMQAWEVTPGEVRGLKMSRVDKGQKVTLPEFGLTSMVVFTNDANLMGRFQDMARAKRQQAAQWSHDMAVYEYDKVAKVHIELEKQGITLPDGNALLEDCRKRTQKSEEMWKARNFAEAYHEAERAMRPLRILMRAHCEKAVRGMDTPVASPYAVSYYTLPKHWQFMNDVRACSTSTNVLVGGDFELAPERVQESWKLVKDSLDNMDLTAERVSEMRIARIQTKPEPDPKLVKNILKPDPKTPPKTEKDAPIEGRQCLKLEVKPQIGKVAPPALERTVLALSSPAVKLPPGTLVQISGLVNIPRAIGGSPDGALMYDSAGGEPLAIRFSAPTEWKKFTVYRRVPASGAISMTVALTGIGTVYFDDLRIEPLVPPGGNVIQAGGNR